MVSMRGIFDIDRSSGSIVAQLGAERASTQKLIVVTNWFEQLRARMSANSLGR